MVTHIPSPTSSNASLPLRSPPSSSGRRESFNSSQTSSSAASHRSPQQSKQRTQSREPPRASSSSTRSSSSNRTLIAPTPIHSTAGYPTAPRSQSGSSVAPSSYRAPSVASTSAAHQPRQTHRAGSYGRSRRSRDVVSEVQNTFPWFGQTGDVKIHLRDRRGSNERRYFLHRLILAQNSRWFETMNRDDNKALGNSEFGRTQSSSFHRPSGDAPEAKEGQAYELDWTNYIDGQGRVPALAPCDPSSALSSRDPPSPSVSMHNKPRSSSISSRRYSASGDVSQGHPPPATRYANVSDDEDVLTAYDNLFLTFYNHSPNLSTTNIATAYVDAKLLLSLASFYSSIDTVGPRIDHHLLQFGSRLWKQIAKYPPSYLKLGHIARSKAIFSEALVHVVGTWPLAQPQLQRGTPGVDDIVVNLVEDKVDELEDLKLRSEVKLLRLSLTTGRGERVGPVTGYLDWLALSLFRQWVADNTTPPQTGILKVKDSPSPISPKTNHATDAPQFATPPRLAYAYRLMAAGGQAYLSHDECKRFLKLQPSSGGSYYSRDNLRRFERRMEELKNLARDIVRPLTRHCLELDPGNDLNYLTCARCVEGDFAYIWPDEAR